MYDTPVSNSHSGGIRGGRGSSGSLKSSISIDSGHIVESEGRTRGRNGITLPGDVASSSKGHLSVTSALASISTQHSLRSKNNNAT